MKTALAICTLICVLFLTGCMNVYVRWPTTER